MADKRNDVERRLGLNEVSQKYDTFDEMCVAVRDQMCKADKVVLRLNWFIGLQAWIVQSNKVYGERSVAEFAEAIGWSTSAMYEAKRFYESWSREDLQYRLVEHGVPYRRALALSRCQDQEQRYLIEQAAYDLDLDDEKTTALVKMANSGAGVPEDPEEMANLVERLDQPDPEVEPTLGVGMVMEDDGRPPRDSGGAADDDDGATLANATADPDNERGALRGITGAADQLDKAVEEVTDKAAALIGALDSLGALTGKNYEAAERRLIGILRTVQGCMGTLYMVNKELADHNIVKRG